MTQDLAILNLTTSESLKRKYSKSRAVTKTWLTVVPTRLETLQTAFLTARYTPILTQALLANEVRFNLTLLTWQIRIAQHSWSLSTLLLNQMSSSWLKKQLTETVVQTTSCTKRESTNKAKKTCLHRIKHLKFLAVHQSKLLIVSFLNKSSYISAIQKQGSFGIGILQTEEMPQLL